ncbi:phosphotransferase [Microbacterium sp. CFBP9034]|uniref:phosphotransferase n=1 Tax=Microbacterium sp. CFBP9034 TaxID=3096540 RepID=UPI002A6AB16F|nr:phosphotransferase [Microbacterium sp. CFBP9034]MDY0909828.1 phosphotransferase [Microbacterium sp. CFBP9034]
MEEALSGGNMDPVVRSGDTVRRVAGPWTEAVHALLDVLQASGVAGAPRALGLDERGREVLTYLPGDVLADAPPDVQWSENALHDAGRLLRRIHDASVELVGAGDLAWRSPRREPAEVICHNDFANYNLIVRDGVLVGVIDFDFAGPGSRVWDLAYLAYRLVPFAEDAADAVALDRGHRLQALIDAYGVAYAPQDVLAVAADRLDDLAEFTRGRAADTGRRDFLDHADMYDRNAAHLRQRAAHR